MSFDIRHSHLNSGAFEASSAGQTGQPLLVMYWRIGDA
jgi:hypothetical protein